MPRFLDRLVADRAGLRAVHDLPWSLPYNLRPQDFLRMIEDLYDLLHEVNTVTHGRGYERLEELLDSAGFSGLISRTVVDGLHKLSRAGSVTRNLYPNGYPDLLPHGVYPADAVQYGKDGGLEVKASRYESSWQSHGPRAGWFCVVQFAIHRDVDLALQDQEPTTVRAVMVAELAVDDWSWQPAGEGRIRSGTASVRSIGRLKLRRGAVWVDPGYEDQHQYLVRSLQLDEFRQNRADLVLAHLQSLGAGEVKATTLANAMSAALGLPPQRLVYQVQKGLDALAASGHASKTRPGWWTLS